MSLGEMSEVKWQHNIIAPALSHRFTSATGEPQLHVATSDFFPSEIGWAMTPGCPFRGKFNKQIRHMLEAGLVTRWLNQLIHDPSRREAQEPQGYQQEAGSQQSLTLDHVQGAYYVLFMGCGVSCLLFMLEIACAWHFPQQCLHVSI